jgi:phosphoglycolate phosphatase-like HAD superfamily hydrolase
MAGVLPEAAAIVGDSSRDVGCGLAADLGTVIGVTTGLQSEAELMAAGADMVLADVTQCLAALSSSRPWRTANLVLDKGK